MRLWLISLLFCIAAVATLPGFYARVKMDRSFPALSRYEFEQTPDVALVGSSMTFRLYEGYFKTPVRNLAIGGGSPLTGLAIIASYKSLPHTILVETNIMSRPVDDALVAAFGAADPSWVKPLRAAISAIYYRVKLKSEAANVEQLPRMEPGEYDISASVETTKAAFKDGLQIDTAVNTAEMKRLVADLEKRGCKVMFYELPYPRDLAETNFARTARAITRAAFPDESWLSIDNIDQLRWVDAAHMDERSAIIVAHQIETATR
jgi:hypothetical protein